MATTMQTPAPSAGADWNLSYRGGSGAPVLILRGIAPPAAWRSFAESLAAAHEVFLPEHPGFGAAAPAPWIDGIDDFAYYYLDRLAANGLDGVTIVAESVGAWIALEMAIRCSDRIAALVLVAPAGIKVERGERGDLFMWDPEERTPRLFADPERARAYDALVNAPEHLAERLNDEYMIARVGWNPPLYNPRLARWLHRVAIPTTLLWGERDRLLPAAHGETVRALLPAATLRVVPGAGHFVHLESPQSLIASLAPAAGVLA